MPTTLNYDIVIYGGTFAGVAAACKAAGYIEANGGDKKIAVIIPDVSGMLGGIGTAGAQNMFDIKPNTGSDENKGKYHGGTFAYLYKHDNQDDYECGAYEQNYSPEKMADLLKVMIARHNPSPYNTVIDVFPDIMDSSLPSGYGYDIVEVSKDNSTGKITSVKIRAITREADGVIRYDSSSMFFPDYILSGELFIDASEDGKLTSVSGVGPSIGRQDWPEEYLPEDDERCCETSSRQQAATLMFKAVLTVDPSHPDSYANTSGTLEPGTKSPIYNYNDWNDSTAGSHPENMFFALKPWNAARNGMTTGDSDQTNEWWFNALLVFNVDGRAHERDRGTSLFPTDMREDYITTDQAWIMAREYIKNNKSRIEAALLNSMSSRIYVTGVSICTDVNNNPIVGDCLYIRETVHTTLSPFNNTHGSEDSNYAVVPIESILAGGPDGNYDDENYDTVVSGQDLVNSGTRIGLAFYLSDINAYEKSDMKDSAGNHIWGTPVTKKLRPDLKKLIQRITHNPSDENPTNPLYAVYMPFESLITSRVPNLMIPGAACGVSSISWSEVRELPNLCVLGDAAGVAAGYSVMHSNIQPSSFTQQNITDIQNYLTGNDMSPPKAILVKT